MRLLLVFIALIPFAQAKTDLQWGFQGRSFPMVGGEFFGEMGKSHVFWGKNNYQNKKPFYGFTRLNVGASSAVLVNSIKTELEIYPLSFLGVAIGYQQVHSNFDFPFFDCQEVYCRGRMERRYIEPRLGLAYKGFIFMGHYRRDHIQHSRSDRPFGEFRKVIVGKSGRDHFEETRIVLGKNFSKQMIGVIHEWSRFRLSREQAHNIFGIYQIKDDHRTLMLGLGGFQSTQMGLGPAFYLRYIYQIKSGPKIL